MPPAIDTTADQPTAIGPTAEEPTAIGPTAEEPTAEEPAAEPAAVEASTGDGDAPVRPRRRLEVLDGLRLVAACVVVVFHLAAGDRSTWHAPAHQLFAGPVFSTASYGWLGVELFFMISGFVICMSTWGKSLRDFAVSRVIRLYPAYWFCALLTTAVLLVDTVRWPALPWKQVLLNMTMFEGFVNQPYVDPSYWTLTVELTFYVMFALILVTWGLTRRRLIGFCVAWLALSLLTNWVTWEPLALIVQPQYSSCFVLGILLYLVHRFGSSPTLWSLIGLSWAIEMYRLIRRTNGQHPSGATLHVSVSVAVVTGFVVLLSLIALGRLNWIRGRWLVVAGGLTYPLYLLHQQIGEAIIGTFDPRVPHWVLLVAVIVLLLAMAWLTHRFVERPLARLIKRLLARRSPSPATPQSA